MKGIPQGRYTKEFREEAVKMVVDGGSTDIIVVAIDVEQVGKGEQGR